MAREYHLGVREATPVKRKLRLEAGSAHNMQQAVADIDRLFGLDRATLDRRRRMLHLAYDASRLSLERIEAILAEHHIGIGQGWWNYTRANHYRFVDQNIKDNAATEPWNCH